MRHPRIPLGVGLYTRADAARLLKMHPQRITRWVKGYSYVWTVADDRRRGHQPPVIKTDLPRIDDTLSISFLELMELRVVREFLAADIPLQTVRVAWHHARQAFETDHPFAHRRVFLDEGRIFMAVGDQSGHPDLLEISSRKRPFQVVAGPIFARSVKEVEFDEKTLFVSRWWPLGLKTPIVLDPRIAFGAPVVEGTRVRTDVLARHGTSKPLSQVAKAYDLDAARVEAAIAFETKLAEAA